MLCQGCGQNDATVHFKHVCEGAVQEMHLCETCAAGKGFTTKIPSIADLLSGLGAQATPSRAEVEKVCGNCHMRLSDFRKTSRLGCAECYGSFSKELAPLLMEMHGAARHTGKAPRSEKRVTDRATLQKELDRAISDQNFEEAARLRDRLAEAARAGDGARATSEASGVRSRAL